MTVRLLLLALIAGALHMQAEPKRGWKRHWSVSIGALAVANAVDIHSSMGGLGANPLLRDSDSRFATGRAIVLKTGIGGGATLVQWLLLRGHPRRRKSFATVNYAVAAATVGIAAHNYGAATGR